MSTGSRRRKGFTLLEAIVAAALTTLGVAGVMGSLGALTKAESMMLERERMQRLAVQKYDELVATGDYATTTSGDFSDYQEDRYQWELNDEPSGVENLDTLTLTVTPVDTNNNASVSVNGLIFVPPPQTDGANGTGNGTGNGAPGGGQ